MPVDDSNAEDNAAIDRRRRRVLQAGAAVTVFPSVVGTVSAEPDVQRVTPRYGEVTVAPGHDVLFEIAVHGTTGTNTTTEWSVDGERLYAEYPSISELPHRRIDDISAGTKEVRASVYDEDGGEELGSVEWTVHVEDGAAGVPDVRRVEPEADEVEIEEGGTADLTMGASHQGGDLHRALWFVGDGDDPLGAEDIGGSEDQSTITYHEQGMIAVLAWAVDERGVINTSDRDGGLFDTPASWSIERKSTLSVTKDGALDGKAEFEVTVSGDLEPTDSFEDHGSDSIDGSTATGVIGPKGGTDTVRYTGDVTDFSLDGPAVVYRDGEEVGPGDLPGWGDDEDGEDEGDGGLPNSLEVTKEGVENGKAEFEVTVSGDIEPTDDFEDHGSDSIDGNTATGIIGPKGGTDTVNYSGEITAFSLDGPAAVYVNGEEVDPDELGDDDGGFPNRLEVTKEGAEDGKAEFEVTVSGDLRPTDSFEDHGSDSIDGNTATGIIGPEGGTDAIEYSGEITDFSLDGPAVVYRNGEEVDPDTLG